MELVTRYQNTVRLQGPNRATGRESHLSLGHELPRNAVVIFNTGPEQTLSLLWGRIIPASNRSITYRR